MFIKHNVIDPYSVDIISQSDRSVESKWDRYTLHTEAESETGGLINKVLIEALNFLFLTSLFIHELLGVSVSDWLTD